MKVPFFEFDCSDREIELVTDVLRSGWLTTGKNTVLFEERFRDACNVSHALAVNSCTAALHLALEALGVGNGDKVVVPSYTFTATAEVIRYLGADPVFVDVDATTALMNVGHLRRAVEVTPGIKACIVVHFGGQPACLEDPNGIWTYCQKKGIRLIQDAAHAFPARDTYGPVGSIGDVTCFSFYANKTITTGEGGMLVTNNANVAERVKVMRLHGINRDVWDRFTSTRPKWEYDVIAPGYKYNMPDVNAAIGLAQLERAETFRSARQRCGEYYYENLKSIDCIDLLSLRVSNANHAWHLFPIMLNDKSPVGRNRLIELLSDDGIATSVHYKPLHRLKYYREHYGLNDKDFPNSERIWQSWISLPIYPKLSEKMLRYVCDRLRLHLE